MDLGGGGQGGKRDRWRGLSFTAGEGPMASERPLEVEPETAGGGAPNFLLEFPQSHCWLTR